ncbi:hypothetical protein U369_27055 [Bacillus anthracis 52-G]|nr:hypothetical protein U368_26865 [Bacillus anthracis 8903-G]EVT95475.1 hypothetical protein U365_26280 [Bacillus anthracis 9080-G]EVU02795.1 hypothetical protein U369_27055 [Bacillus anthracis 52-G]EXJ17794.1 hypothetical protein Y693_26785 [Bacillus anthracis str. 95014]
MLIIILKKNKKGVILGFSFKIFSYIMIYEYDIKG